MSQKVLKAVQRVQTLGTPMQIGSLLKRQEFESSIQILTPEQKLRIDQAAAFIGAKVTPEIKGNPQAVLGSDIMNLLTALHGHRWGTPGSKRSPSIADLGNFEAHMGFIIDLEKIIQDVEPRGIRRNAVSRQAAIDSLDTIFAGHSADEIAEAKRLVTNLAGNPAEGPMMRAAPDFGSDAARGSFFSPTASKNDLQIGEGGGATPKIQILNHEIGHWAYMNILTAKTGSTSGQSCVLSSGARRWTSKTLSHLCLL